MTTCHKNKVSGAAVPHEEHIHLPAALETMKIRSMLGDLTEIPKGAVVDPNGNNMKIMPSDLDMSFDLDLSILWHEVSIFEIRGNLISDI